MNVLASACSSLSGQRIDINEITIGLNQSKSKKNFLEKLNEMNWFPALEGYKSYLNQQDNLGELEANMDVVYKTWLND